MSGKQRVLCGGYPEAVSRPTPRRRAAWAKQYMDAIIQRDVRDISGIEKIDQLPRFLNALAQTAGQMCNYAQLGGQIGYFSGSREGIHFLPHSAFTAFPVTADSTIFSFFTKCENRS